MSKASVTNVSCGHCGGTQPARLFESLNGDRIAHAVDAVLDGSFEQLSCERCGQTWRPEHTMLFSLLSRGVWIVMYPVTDRRQFATLETGVADVLRRNFDASPPIVADQLRGVRPRLVFGQHMLSEAVRLAARELPPALVECAKLLTVRRRLAELTRWGVFELAVERIDDRGELACGVHALPGGARLGALTIARDALEEARATQPAVEHQFAELVSSPYITATRYVYGASG
ncbi:MAG: CpXC domain-containing protein [Kofleriaceae bacterium]